MGRELQQEEWVGGGGMVAGKGGDCLMLKSWNISFPTHSCADIMNYIDISHSVT